MLSICVGRSPRFRYSATMSCVKLGEQRSMPCLATTILSIHLTGAVIHASLRPGHSSLEKVRSIMT